MKNFRIGWYLLIGLALAGTSSLGAQDSGMIAGLVSELGITETQATGGLQAILGAAQGNLSGEDYASLIGGAPALQSAAEAMIADEVTDALEGEVEVEAESETESVVEAAMDGVTETATDLSAEAATAVVTGALTDSEDSGSSLTDDLENMADNAGDEVVADLTDTAVSAAGDAVGLDMSSLGQLAGLTSQFESLDMDSEMVQKFVPVVLQYLGQDSDTTNLLVKGLGLLQ